MRQDWIASLALAMTGPRFVWMSGARLSRRPPVEQPKVHIGFRLASDVVEGVRATGKGYNARVEKVLREALAKGDL